LAVLVTVSAEVGLASVKRVAEGSSVNVGRGVGVIVGSTVRVGVQVGSNDSSVGVAGIGVGRGVGGGKGFRSEFGFMKRLTKKPTTHNVPSSITPVSTFQIRSGLEFLFIRLSPAGYFGARMTLLC
jgi:hypothetical protein